MSNRKNKIKKLVKQAQAKTIADELVNDPNLNKLDGDAYITELLEKIIEKLD